MNWLVDWFANEMIPVIVGDIYSNGNIILISAVDGSDDY